MLSREAQSYIRRVSSRIRFSYDRPAVREELESHLEEKTEALLASGLPAEEANRRAVEEMGDAEALGKALDRAHNPVVGRLWWLSVRLFILCAALFCVRLGGSLLDNAADSRERNVEESHHIVSRVELNQKIKLDSRVIRFEKLLMDDEGGAHLLYSTWFDRPFENGWTFHIGTLEDDLGNSYAAGGQSQGGIVSRCISSAEDIDPAAAMLYAVYDGYNRSFRVELPLREGEAHG